MGRRHHKAKATTKAKRKTTSTSKTGAPVATAIAPAFDLQNTLTEHLDLEFSTITDAIDPTVKITEPLARLFSTRQRTLVTILTLLRYIMCQTLRKTQLMPPLVKALQQAPILQHRLSRSPALICAWIVWTPTVKAVFPILIGISFWSWIKVPSILCPVQSKPVRLHLHF